MLMRIPACRAEKHEQSGIWMDPDLDLLPVQTVQLRSWILIPCRRLIQWPTQPANYSTNYSTDASRPRAPETAYIVQLETHITGPGHLRPAIRSWTRDFSQQKIDEQ